MARAYGSSAHLLLKRETVYGQAATGDYIRMPFNRCDLGSEQGLIDDPVLGQGRDPLAPFQDVINDEGDIVLPVDPRYLGLWLTGLFGDPATTDNLDGSWDHEFTSGGEDLPSYTIEVGMSQVPAFFVHAGVKLGSIALEFTRSGPAAATINAIAQGETRFSATQGGTPTSLTFNRISQFQGSIKRAGSPVGNLTAGSVTYANNLEKIETIRDDGLIEGADPTIAALTGRIDVRFADTTLVDLAAGGTPVDLEFAYTLSALAKLVLTAHEVYLPKPKLAVEGPGGVQASFDFRGARNDVAGRMLTATLTNDLDGTVWLGTPWRHQGRLKGVAVDCGGLIIGVGRELGLLDFDTRAYGRIPDGQQLRALCEQHLVSKPITEITPGDVLLMRFTRHPQHLAIVGDRGTPFSLIHAYADAGACVEHGADPRWLRRIVAAFSFRQPD